MAIDSMAGAPDRVDIAGALAWARGRIDVMDARAVRRKCGYKKTRAEAGFSRLIIYRRYTP